jgi:DNA-directed RNA polymerase specialized sigma subunit
MEIWKDVIGYEGLYQISNIGRFKSFKQKKERIVKIRVTRKGYEYVGLSKKATVKKQTIHRLVAEAFIENKENKPCVNHINGIKSDNRVENLEWVTYSENNKHAIINNLKPPKRGDENHFSKITTEQAIEIKYFTNGLLQKEIAKKYGIKDSSVSYIKSGKSWKHI